MIGLDEVGRGAWAGPLLVVAAEFKGQAVLSNIKDSKLHTKRQRELLHTQLILTCNLGVGWVEPQEIDDVGLSNAMRLAVTRALLDIKAKINDEIIIDGNINYCPQKFVNSRCQINADETVPVVSAASIIAKVMRDDLMAELASEYPNYGFEKHVGYGTKYHREALAEFGVSKIHRLSYKPIKSFM